MVRPALRSGSFGATGDISRKTNPFLSDDGYYSLKNFHMDEAGALTKWNGIQIYNTNQLIEGGNPAKFTGIFDYQKSSGQAFQIATGLTGVYRYGSPITNSWNALSLPAPRTGTIDDIYDGLVLNDVLYLCNGVDENIKYNGTGVYNAGISAPTNAAVAAAGGSGVLTGAYSYRYTYYSSIFGQESNPAPVSNTFIASSQQISLSGMSVSTDPQVDKKRIYRTTAGGGVWLFVAEVDNSATTYVDNNTDASLGIALEEFANGTPPVAKFMAVYKNHVFMCGKNSSRVYFSRPGFPGSVNSNDFRDLDPNDGDIVTGIKRLYADLVVYKENSIWNGYGDDRTSFVFTRMVSGIGALNQHSIVSVPGQNRHIFMSGDGNLYSYNGSTASLEAIDIQPILRKLNKSKLSMVQGLVYTQKNLCIWLVPDTGSAYGNLLITYDYFQNKWALRPIPNTLTNTLGILEAENGSKDLFLGGYDGYVYQADAGLSDNGFPIACEVIDRSHPKGIDSAATKSFYEIKVWFKPQAGAVLYVSYAIDDPDGTYYQAGTIDCSDSTGQGRVRFNALGRRLFPKLYENSIGTPLVIRGWQILYKDLGRD